jgi:hypothetical protein
MRASIGRPMSWNLPGWIFASRQFYTTAMQFRMDVDRFGLSTGGVAQTRLMPHSAAKLSAGSESRRDENERR